MSLEKGVLCFQQSPDTFEVEERLAYEPCGEGPHMFAQVRKRGVNTHWVTRRLSEALGIPLKHMRHAGKKDAAATATQWLSWPIEAQKKMAWPQSQEAFEILRTVAHTNGLALGHIKTNAFTLRLKAASGLALDIEKLTPFPNFFGAQRFGSGPRHWCEWMSPAQTKKMGKDRISIIQALLFNTFLATRFEASGRTHFEDDYWMHLSGKRFFQVVDESEVLDRYHMGEITPSGPLFGYKVPLRQVERDFLERYQVQQEMFRAWGKMAKGTRRPLWMLPTAFSAVQGDDQLVLKFELPSGVYATVFLLHLFSPQALWLPSETWPNFTEPVRWQKGDRGFEMAMV